MTLKDLVIKYRTENGLSQRQFALQCGLSNGYISMIERGVNPSTGEKITPLWQFILTNTGIIVPAMEWKPEKRLSD